MLLAGKFTTLLSLVESVGETQTLMTGGPFTVFAPINAAFKLLKDKDQSLTQDQVKKVPGTVL
jgi:uncharacterized surface protein with fasciclin (FAS1) repeats